MSHWCDKCNTDHNINCPADTIAKLEAMLSERECEMRNRGIGHRLCEWRKQTLGMYGEYDSWNTSCGEDYAIEEEWHEKPTKFCANCGGKTVDATPPKAEALLGKEREDD